MPPAKKSRKPAPAGSYALPGGGPGGADAYPIQDKAHGANALSRVAANGTPAEKKKVRAAVKAKYPGLPSSQGKGKSAADRAKPRSGKS